MKDYIEFVIKKFENHKDAEKAIPMEKYMQNKFKFIGIKKPERNVIQKQIGLEIGSPSVEELPVVIKSLWDLPYREYQYFALNLLEKYKNRVPPETIDLYYKLITTKSWWDSVDSIAVQLVGPLVGQHPKLIKTHIEHWSLSTNIWLKRTSILYQLKYKSETDTDLLSLYIKRSMNTQEFFLNKAIGWALREYGKSNPNFTVDFVAGHLSLSNLSKREAMKYIGTAK
ncbi:MAG: DNA alkylation repair protein [Flavobacteriales bacterium]|nr:DNA alkylation repair protein [Flavobacteriales bacterium]